MSRIFGRLGASLVLPLLASLVSCASGDTPRHDPPADAALTDAALTEGVESAAVDPTAPARPDWSIRLDAIGQPVVVDDVAVVLATNRDRGLDVVGVGVRDGGVRWRHAYDVAPYLHGQVLTPEVLESRSGRRFVVYVEEDRDRRPDEAPATAVVALDPGTGKEVRRLLLAALGAWAEHPLAPCADGHDACSSGFNGRPARDTAWRLDLDTWRVRRVPGAPDGARPIGGYGLLSSAARPGEELVGLDADGERWRRPITEVFGRRATTDWGWSVDHVEDLDVYTGSVGIAPPRRAQARFDAGEAVTYRPSLLRREVGVDAATGEVLWRIPGATSACAYGAEGVGVACVARGRITEQRGEDIDWDDLEVELRGYDLRTGEPDWSLSLTSRFARAMWVREVAPLGPGGLVVVTSDGPVHVAYDDGATTPVARRTVLFCADDLTRIEVYGVGRLGGRLLFPCDPSGRRVDGPVAAWVLGAIPDDQRSGDHAVVALDGRLVGYPVRRTLRSRDGR